MLLINALFIEEIQESRKFYKNWASLLNPLYNKRGAGCFSYPIMLTTLARCCLNALLHAYHAQLYN